MPLIDNMRYTWQHKKAFLKLEKQLLGRNTLRGYLHDTDKLFLYLLPLKSKTVQYIHRKIASHHVGSIRKPDYEAMVIDWECARFTKPDKPLDAYDTLFKYYPEQKDYILPILAKFNLMNGR